MGRAPRLPGLLAGWASRARARLRSRRAREVPDAAAYFGASPIAMLAFDGAGRWLDANAAACALTGFSREELVGAPITAILAGEQPPERLMGLLALGAGATELRVRRKNGSFRHCLLHVAHMDPERLIGALLDVTDRRQAEDRLRESEERFRSLSEASLEPILIHDGARIVDANQALCELAGYSWHELVGRDVLELFGAEHRERFYRSLLAEHEAAYEVEVQTHDGALIPVEVQARSLSGRDGDQRVVAVRDLSPRRAAAAVRDSLVRELEARNAELERFGYAVSHELKVPLVTIRGFAEHIERDLEQGRTDRARQDALRIRDASERLQRMVDELIALSGSTRPLGPPVAVGAEDLVREALRLAAREDDAPPARVDVVGPLPVVYGDRPRLVQVFRKLLDAKLAATPRSARVRIEAGVSPEGKALLVVRDDAPRAESRRAEAGPPQAAPEAVLDGPGAGLAVVRRIVESHGGRVWVDSASGSETAYCLTLPQPPRSARGAVGGVTRSAARREG